MNYEFHLNTPIEAFDHFVSQHPLGSILQKSLWANIKNNWGHYYTSVTKDDEIVCTALVLVRDLPLGFKLYYLPRGPVCDFHNKELLTFFFESLKKQGKKDHAICAKFDPLVVYDAFHLDEHVKKEGEDEVTSSLKSIGAHHFGYNYDMYAATQPRTQAVFYYEEGWKDHPTNLLKKYLQRAKNKHVQLIRGDVSHLDTFAKLMEKTGERKGVALRSKEYFQRMMEVYGDDCAIYLTFINQKEQLEANQKELERIQKDLEEHPRSEKKMGPIRETILGLQNEIHRLEENIPIDGDIAWISCSMCVKDEKHSELFYAGMDGKYSKYYGPYVSYYAAIEWALDSGCTMCNFGGVQGTLDDGLTPFKETFHPMFEEYIGEFDYPILTLMYPLFTKALPIAKKAIKLLAK